MRIPPSISTKTQVELGLIQFVSSAGETLKSSSEKPIANTNEPISAKRLSSSDASSSPSSVTEKRAETESARMPIASDSPRATMPRMTGSRSQRRRSATLSTSCSISEMRPSGRRTATAQLEGPRIITPSSTA